MKLLIFGATGGTGRQLVDQALAQGHEVTAFVRKPSRLPVKHDKLIVMTGSILDQADIDAAVAGHDAVLSALGIRLNFWPLIVAIVVSQILIRIGYMERPQRLLLGLGLPVLALLWLSRTPPLLSRSTKLMVCAMERSGVKRFICESSMGVGDSRGQGGFIFTWIVLPILLRHVFADKEAQEKIIEASPLQWVIVRPGGLTNGPRTGKYRAGFEPTDCTITCSISRADVADFMLKQVTDDTYLGKKPGVSY